MRLAKSFATPPKPQIRVTSISTDRSARLCHRRSVSRPHARPDRAAWLFDLEIEAHGDLHIDDHHTVEERHHARPGRREGRRRPQGHPPLRACLRAARRGAVARRDRFFRPSGPRITRAVHARHASARSTSICRSSFSGLRQSRRRHTAHRQPARPERAPSDAKPCSRRSPVRCAWPSNSTARPGRFRRPRVAFKPNQAVHL